MSDIPEQQEALRFSIDSVLWQAREKPFARKETLQVLLSILAIVSEYLLYDRPEADV